VKFDDGLVAVVVLRRHGNGGLAFELLDGQVQSIDGCQTPSSPSVLLCTEAALRQRLSLELPHHPVTDVEMEVVLKAFVRVFGPGPGAPTGTENVEGEAFWRGGFDEYATGSTEPRRFHEGQPVMVQLDERLAACPKRLGVVRGVGGSEGCHRYTIEVSDGSSEGEGEGERPTATVHLDGVEVAQLCSATGRMFDGAAEVQQHRSAYLESIAERIGREDPGGKCWKAEVPTVVKEQWVQAGHLASMDDPKYERMLAGADSSARSFESFCEHPPNKKAIDGILERSSGALSREDAQLLAVCDHYGCVLAAAARESRGD
jgi:hypothetical protein